MTRQTITITADEKARAQPDGTLWLVREGERVRVECYCNPKPPTLEGQHSPHCNIRRQLTPPAVFVQACAPCGTCGGSRCVVPPDCDCDRVTSLNYALCTHPPADCTDCRIELVGPCEIDGCRWSPHRTLGHAYAVGQPLPIIDGTITHATYPPDCLFTSEDGTEIIHDADMDDESITAALAHYGPPETLVGRWAIQLRVTP
jgi:hypothetical protein